jgi:hypothetical protein
MWGRDATRKALCEMWWERAIRDYRISDGPMKMVKIAGELAKAAGIDPGAEPMPLDFILECAEVMMPRYSRLKWTDISAGEPHLPDGVGVQE